MKFVRIVIFAKIVHWKGITIVLDVANATWTNYVSPAICALIAV